MQTYRIENEPTYTNGTAVHSDWLVNGALVRVLHNNLGPDSDGDVKVYAVDAEESTWLYVNAAHLVPVTAAADRAASIREAKALLREDATAHELIAMAQYLQDGTVSA